MNKQISQTVDAIIRGVANYHAGQRRLLEMRLIEAERRIAELEQERRR